MPLNLWGVCQFMNKLVCIYEGKKDHNSLQNFNFEERIFFTRNENNLKIIVNSGNAFFQTKFEDNLKIQLGMLLIFYTFILNFILIPNILIKLTKYSVLINKSTLL